MPPEFDVAIVGGGLAGSALALSLAKHGKRVLILERDAVFRDRVRGEGMHPWGVVEAREVSILKLLLESCAQELPYWTRHNAAEAAQRDLRRTTPAGTGCLTFYHPDMQERLLRAATDAGAVVWRPSLVLNVEPGPAPRLVARAEGRELSVSARLIVGADGRASRTRKCAGFQVRSDPHVLRIAGVLYEGIDLADDSVHVVDLAGSGRKVLIFPIGNQRFRTYYVSLYSDEHILSGDHDVQEFLDACTATGVPARWLKHARAIGPLASFDAADRWVDHPYRNGVVLIGDAAAASDPSYGCGLGLTLRDVRVLRDELMASDDYDDAANKYACKHTEYYGALHRILSWYRELNYAPGPEADARRRRVLTLMEEQPERRPDFLAFGPDAPSDQSAHRRFFGDA